MSSVNTCRPGAGLRCFKSFFSASRRDRSSTRIPETLPDVECRVRHMGAYVYCFQTIHDYTQVVLKPQSFSVRYSFDKHYLFLCHSRMCADKEQKCVSMDRSLVEGLYQNVFQKSSSSL